MSYLVAFVAQSAEYAKKVFDYHGATTGVVVWFDDTQQTVSWVSERGDSGLVVSLICSAADDVQAADEAHDIGG